MVRGTVSSPESTPVGVGTPLPTHYPLRSLATQFQLLFAPLLYLATQLTLEVGGVKVQINTWEKVVWMYVILHFLSTEISHKYSLLVMQTFVINFHDFFLELTKLLWKLAVSVGDYSGVNVQNLVILSCTTRL